MRHGGDRLGGEGRRLRHRREDVEEVVVFVRGRHRDVERRLGGGRLGCRRRRRGPRRGRGRTRRRHLHRLGRQHLVEQLFFRRRRGGWRLVRKLRDRGWGGVLRAQGRRSLVDQLLDPRRLRIHLFAQGRLRGLRERVEQRGHVFGQLLARGRRRGQRCILPRGARLADLHLDRTLPIGGSRRGRPRGGIGRRVHHVAEQVLRRQELVRGGGRILHLGRRRRLVRPAIGHHLPDRHEPLKDRVPGQDSQLGGLSQRLIGSYARWRVQ
jgi:hypothetical protein